MAVSGQRAATMSQPQLVLLTTALQGIRVNDAVRSVVASSPRSARSGVSATRPPPTQPPRAAVASENFVPDNALEVEGRTDWRMNVKAKPVRDAPLGKRIREFLSDVEARIASAKVGSLGTIAHERRHILASVVGGAADAGFLITLGQAIEQLRALSEQPLPEELVGGREAAGTGRHLASVYLMFVAYASRRCLVVSCVLNTYIYIHIYIYIYTCLKSFFCCTWCWRP